MSSELAAVLFGLASAVSWGSGDFFGGLAAKRTRAYVVVVGSQIVGLLPLLTLVFLLEDKMPSRFDMALGAVAGIASGIGLVAFYAGLARGPMGIVATVAALFTVSQQLREFPCRYINPDDQNYQADGPDTPGDPVKYHRLVLLEVGNIALRNYIIAGLLPCRGKDNTAGQSVQVNDVP